MLYTITFEAHTASGDVAAVRTFSIGTDHPLEMTKKKMGFERMCVEYARLTGVKCSYAHILQVTTSEEEYAVS
jgi:hypothetical protein